jgi:hypothetical protein
MVQGDVMKGMRVLRLHVMPHGERPNVNALPPLHHHFRAAQEAAMFFAKSRWFFKQYHCHEKNRLKAGL